MSEPWILDDFETALKQLEVALSGPIKSDLERAGCIQYFEFTFELAWKSIRMAASELGQPDCLSPKACLKQAFTNGWIGNGGNLAENAGCQKSNVAYVPGKGRTESVRVSAGFPAGIEPTPACLAKVRRMKFQESRND